MADWLRELGFDVDAVSGYHEAIAALAKKTYDLALVDIRLADGDGFDVLAHCREHRPQTAVILMTGYGSVETAIEAIRAGAFDLVTKPLVDDELEMSIDRALNHRRVVEENKNLKAQLDLRFGLESIVGHDYRMRHVFDMVNSVADTKATVLITGESGTGKSMIARAMHRRSSRRDKPFVEVACGALPETLLESELFGHAAGSFTGATGEKIGKFTLADGGTIFLDEIGTASPAMQVKLLRVLQDFEFEQVGGTKTFHVEARVILATNENLEESGVRGTVPPGPVLPRERDQYRAAATARSDFGHSDPGHALSRSMARGLRQEDRRLHRRGPRGAGTLSLAGQCPRARKRHRTGRAVGQEEMIGLEDLPASLTNGRSHRRRTGRRPFAQTGDRRARTPDHPGSAGMPPVEPPCHGRRPGHQPHHAL